ncbi:porin [Paroceanicella profunda]|uniref:Porin n=1 Tax=Paroceanicella profunda TaxID=2579971 RepID=A0A5B8FG80_9RHOB|nr:porin [Paroceanicella profunda]QDL90871.1 porin [Paroceanicella profunda]
MKKVLFASTALVAASLGSASFAAEPITGSVGGYMMMGLVYMDEQGDEIGVLRDGEIHLGWKGTSDNGLTFDGRIELEAYTTGDQIDENWARVSGTFGSVMIGSDDSASNAMEKGVFYGAGSRVGYWDSFYSAMYTSMGGDVPVIRYTTPNISGFSAAIDWAPNSSADGSRDNNLVFGNYEDGSDADGQRWSVGAKYEGEFDGVGFGIGAGYLDGDADVYDDGRWHVGGEVSYVGFSVGVHYDSAGWAWVGPAGFSGYDDSLAVGMQYETGPWTFGAGWAFALAGPDANNYGAWVTYAIAPGVTGTLGYEGNDVGEYNTVFRESENMVTGYLRVAF